MISHVLSNTYLLTLSISTLSEFSVHNTMMAESQRTLTLKNTHLIAVQQFLKLN